MAKKNFDYFEALINMSRYALDGAVMLHDFLSNYHDDAMADGRVKLHELEHRCDTEKHELTTALVKEFLPPIEREDLFRLSHVMDNLMDRIDSVASFLYMANITRLRSDTSEFTLLIIQSCEYVVELMKEFKNYKKSSRLYELIIKLNDIEERGDRLYNSAVRKLSSQEGLDAREVIEWRDVYRNFETCYDAAESIADNIELVVLKNS